ncbi:MAG: calcium-binding protein, partial [Paracoccaceae bacterium]
AGDDTLLGRNGADTLIGRDGDDALDGGPGDDVLQGGAGADTLDGGDQTDTASYQNAADAIRADLNFQGRNSGDAAGDSFTSIEDISGSSWGDAIYGDIGDNTLWGNGDADWLVGRAGDDALYGGGGDDVLQGGAGADLLDGGSGTDRAQYMMSKQGISIDLANSAANTGIAAGDVFVSIEDLAGTPFDDQIAGNGGANQLLGNGGDDLLQGAAGADNLLGGDGNDRLEGGTGDDTLNGGTGADVFVFGAGTGNDTVQDFNAGLDQLELTSALIGATPATGTDVVASYATLTGADVLLDFGGGDAILIEDFSDLTALADAIGFA